MPIHSKSGSDMVDIMVGRLRALASHKTRLQKESISIKQDAKSVA